MDDEMKRITTAVVDQVDQLRLEGNITPHSWYKRIKTESGKTDHVAIAILADVMYWYRPTYERDESTGEIALVKKKFHADKLQKSYRAWADQFGFSKEQVKEACDRLVKAILITREFRDIHTQNGVLSNVMYIEPVVENVRKITYRLKDNGGGGEKDPQVGGGKPPDVGVEMRGTYTDTSSNTTTKVPPPTAETLVDPNNACSQTATPPPFQSKIGGIAGSDYNDVGKGNGHSEQTRSAVATRIEHPFLLQEKDLAAQVRANAEFDAMPSASVGMPPRKTNNASIASPIAWRGNGAVGRVARELELLVGSSHKCEVAAKKMLAEMQDEERLIAVIQEISRDEMQAAFARKAGAMPMVNTVLHQCKQRAQAPIQTHSRGRGFVAPVMVE